MVSNSICLLSPVNTVSGTCVASASVIHYSAYPPSQKDYVNSAIVVMYTSTTPEEGAFIIISMSFDTIEEA